MRPIDPRPVPTAGREDEQVHKTAIFEALTAGVKSAFKEGPLSSFIVAGNHPLKHGGCPPNGALSAVAGVRFVSRTIVR